MAVPSPELMAEIMASPTFRSALADLVRGYRWEWRRVGGKQWSLTRMPVSPYLSITFDIYNNTKETLL